MSRKIKLIAILAIIAVTFYLMARTVLVIDAEYRIADNVLAVLLLLAELFFVIHALGYARNVLKSEKYQEPEVEPMKTGPEVAVIIATRHEPKNVVEDTILTVKNLDYQDKNIYVLDDSTEKRFVDEMNELCEEYDIEVVRREELKGAKAGAINNFLKTMEEEYLAIFDADQNPMPGYLSRVVPQLKEDEDLAFVQTPQSYTNIKEIPITRIAQAHQSIFYKYILEGKSEMNSAFACGTNLVLSREALLDVGGFDEDSVTEDFATSLKMHMKGYKSKYDSRPGVFGMAPASLQELITQQNRWATGTVGILRKLFKNLFTSSKSLSITQWSEYFLSGSYYFIGWAFFILMLCPILFLIFNIPSYFASPEIYLLFYIPYFALTLGLFYSTMRSRGFSIGTIYHGSIMAFLIFPTLMSATIVGLTGKKIPFGVTGKGDTEKMPLKSLWPQISMIILSVLALIAGGLGLLAGGETAPLVVNMIWVGYHLFVLSHIFYYNKER